MAPDWNWRCLWGRGRPFLVTNLLQSNLWLVTGDTAVFERGVNICVFTAKENTLRKLWPHTSIYISSRQNSRAGGCVRVAIYIWLSAATPELCIAVCGSRVWTVWYSCINTKSAWRSAADVKALLTSPVFLLLSSQCHHGHASIQLCGAGGVEWRSPSSPLDTDA